MDPESFVNQWTRTTAALWIGHPQAPVYLQELDLFLRRPPIRSSVRNAWTPQTILAYPSLCERLEPLAFVMACWAVEQQPSHATTLAPLFKGIGQHAHAARLLQIAQEIVQTDTRKGNSSYEKGSDTYTVVGCGADIGGPRDEFHFVYKELEGNGSIIARIESFEDVHPRAQAGVMIRANLDPGAKFAAVFAMPTNGVSYHTRPITNRNATADDDMATPEQTALRAPVWVKLERQGDQFSAFYSSDGASWIKMAGSPQRVSMPENVYIGLAVTSHDSQKTAAARISHVTTTGEVSPLRGPFTGFQDIRPQLPPSPNLAKDQQAAE